MDPTADELRGVHAGLYVRMDIRVEGAEAVVGDGMALGAALADLKREGWSVESIKVVHAPPVVEPVAIRAVLVRSWGIDDPKVNTNGYAVQDVIEKRGRQPMNT